MDEDGEIEDDSGAAAGGVLDPDAPAVCHDDRLRDRKTKSAAWEIARAVAADEGLEDPLAIGRRDARSVVDDTHAYQVSEHGGRQLNLAAPRRVAKRVLQQVREDLVYLERVDGDIREIRTEDGPGGDTRLVETRPHPREHRGRDLVQGDGLRRQSEGACPDPGEVHDVADEPVQSIRLLEDGGEQFVLLLGIMRRILVEEAGDTGLDRRKRRAQVVRHA
jgi:hypothetical protein